MQGRVSSDEVDPRLELEQLSRVRHEQRVHLLRVERDLASVVSAACHLHGTGKSRLSARRESAKYFFLHTFLFAVPRIKICFNRIDPNHLKLILENPFCNLNSYRISIF